MVLHIAASDLGLLYADFPNQTLFAASVVTDVGNAATEPTDNATTRQPTVPFSSLEEYVPWLEEYLLHQFSWSTFNTDQIILPHLCQLSSISSTYSKPYVCHTPASVPIYWEVEVKEQLDAEVRKGILEPVPLSNSGVLRSQVSPGTPLTTKKSSTLPK